MRTSHSIPILALVLVAATSAPLEAQNPHARRVREDSVARMLSGIRLQREVRVSVPGSTLVGNFGGLRADSAVVTPRSLDTRAVALSEITSVSIRTRRVWRSTGRGALWGGALFGVTALIATYAEPDCDYCINDPMDAALIFAIPGLMAGAVVGHVVGWVNRPWRRLYP
jgi:hypothetical protein